MLAHRYRTLGAGGIICLVLHYCSLLITLSFCLGTLPLFALFALASIATLWLLNKPAFVLGIAAVVAQLLVTATLTLGVILVWVTGSGWLEGTLDPDLDILFGVILAAMPLLCLVSNILSMVFFVVKRKAFGIGAPQVEVPADSAYKDPWD